MKCFRIFTLFPLLLAFNAVPSDLGHNNEDISNWTESFILKNGKSITHTPNGVTVMAGMQAVGMFEAHSAFDGTPLAAPLFLAYDMSREDFVAGLVRSGLYDDSKKPSKN